MARETITQRLNRIVREIEAIRERAAFYHAESSAARFSAEMARSLVKQARSAQEGINAVPRTPATGIKAEEEWQYPTGQLLTDVTAIETAVATCASWVATRDNQLWTGYGMADTFPWAETIPVFTANQTSGLRANLTDLIAACDTFLGKVIS